MNFAIGESGAVASSISSVDGPHVQEVRAHPLAGDLLRRLDVQAEHVPEERERRAPDR